MLHRLGTVESTQLAAADLPLGSVVVAEHQTAGRGRLGRRWEAPAGSGLFIGSSDRGFDSEYQKCGRRQLHFDYHGVGIQLFIACALEW